MLLIQGELDAGRACFQEAMGLFEELDDARGLAESLAGMASVAAAGGQWPQAVRLAGAAADLRGRRGISRSPAEVQAEEGFLASARGALGDAAFAAAWAEGRRLAPGDAVRAALRLPAVAAQS